MSAAPPGAEPIVLTVDLDVAPEEAFRRFTAGFGDWWPVRTHSLSRDATTRCVMDPMPGGRVYEVAPDGSQHDWGAVTSFSPGRSVCFTWHPGREPDSAQWIEVTFAPQAGGCRATLTHGGWEALGDIAPILRREYVPGWQHVFGELFARHAVIRH